MRAAKHKDMPAVTSAQASQIAPAPTGAPGGIVPASGEANTWPSSYNQRPTRVDGKVFFTDNFGPELGVLRVGGQLGISPSCLDGRALRIRHRLLVQRPGRVVPHNWVFVPGYKNGTRPYGTWTALEQWTLNGYCNGYWPSAIPYDTGAVVLNPLNGHRILDVTGGYGLQYNVTNLPAVWDFGYPAAAPYNGQVLRYCHGGTFVDSRTTYNQGGHRPHGLACRLNGGSSGGPWVIGTPQTTGNGYINGENSYSFSGDTTHIYSPYYGTAQGNLFNTVRNRYR